MDSLNNYRKLVKHILTDYAEIPVFDKVTQKEIIFDLENDRYMLINIGWFNEQRVHYCVIHIQGKRILSITRGLSTITRLYCCLLRTVFPPVALWSLLRRYI